MLFCREKVNIQLFFSLGVITLKLFTANRWEATIVCTCQSARKLRIQISPRFPRIIGINVEWEMREKSHSARLGCKNYIFIGKIHFNVFIVHFAFCTWNDRNHFPLVGWESIPSFPRRNFWSLLKLKQWKSNWVNEFQPWNWEIYPFQFFIAAIRSVWEKFLMSHILSCSVTWKNGFLSIYEEIVTLKQIFLKWFA